MLPCVVLSLGLVRAAYALKLARSPLPPVSATPPLQKGSDMEAGSRDTAAITCALRAAEHRRADLFVRLAEAESDVCALRALLGSIDAQSTAPRGDASRAQASDGDLLQEDSTPLPGRTRSRAVLEDDCNDGIHAETVPAEPHEDGGAKDPVETERGDGASRDGALRRAAAVASVAYTDSGLRDKDDELNESQTLLVRVAAAGLAGKLVLSEIPELAALRSGLDEIRGAVGDDAVVLCRAWVVLRRSARCVGRAMDDAVALTARGETAPGTVGLVVVGGIIDRLRRVHVAGVSCLSLLGGAPRGQTRDALRQALPSSSRYCGRVDVGVEGG